MPSQSPLHSPMIGACVSFDGYCLCGCGQRTQVVKRNQHKHGVLMARRGQHSGYVQGHATRQRKKLPPEHFLRTIRASYVVSGSGCWEWTGRQNGESGYGAFWCDGRDRLAHRAHWELVNGPVPDGLHLDHLCRNHLCIRLDHLEPVTGWVNIVERGVGASSVNFRKTECIRGHPFDEQNTYRDDKGRRQCARCQYLRVVIRHHRSKGYGDEPPFRIRGHQGKWVAGRGICCNCGVFITRVASEKSDALRAHRAETWADMLAEFALAPDDENAA